MSVRTSVLILDFHHAMDVVFWFRGLLHDVRGKFTDYVSKTAVGPIFIGYE
jgi:hypothetical protein